MRSGGRQDLIEEGGGGGGGGGEDSTMTLLFFPVQYDLPKSQREITSEEALAFARDNGFIRYFETSVKDGTNLNEALE